MTTGTTTRAAELLRTSQPSISRMIGELERSTGLSLFARQKGRLVPTAEAKALFEQIERSFEGLNRLRQTVLALRHAGVGRLEVASMPALGLGFLPRVLGAFRRGSPETFVSLRVHSSATVRELVLTRRCDLGLAADEVDTSGVDFELFASVPGICALPPDHPLAAKREIRPGDLAGESFISLAPEDTARIRIDAAFENAEVERRLLLETQYAATICSMVLAGLGVGIVNPFSAVDFLDRGLVMLPFRPAIPFRSLILSPPGRGPSLVIDRFVAILKANRDETLERFRQLGMQAPLR